MAVVDADDDSVDRFVLWHYRFDAERHERRNVVLAAFDNEVEFLAEVERRSVELQEQQRSGAAEAVERIGGVYLTAGSAARTHADRAAWRAIVAHGRASWRRE